MQKTLLSNLLLASYCLPLSIHAASNNESIDLPETVVTATRTETDRSELATATTVFTREDIEKQQVRTLPELLRSAPGVEMVERGGYGKDPNLFMRGTNANHVLVLIDGIKAGSVTSGQMAYQFVPIEQIERVEIIRGPQSSLYGSEAIGGVIQIFTRKGSQTDKPSISMDAGAGSYDTFTTSGNISGKWQNSWYSLGASHLNSQGINSKKDFELDRDGYYNTGINARAGHHFDNNAEVEAFFMRSEGKTEFDRNTRAITATSSNKTDFINQMIGVNGSFDIAKNWRSTLRFGQTQDLSDQFRSNGAFFSQFDTTRWNATWLNEVALSNNHKLTLGTDYRLDEIQTSSVYKENSRYDTGVFGQLHSRFFDNHFMNASLRWDNNETFGESVTGNFGWRYNWQHGLSAFASFGNAFNAPTFNQLYNTDIRFPGNPALKPEESTSFEAGVSGNHDWANWEIRAYHTNIDNLIQFVSNTPAQNIDKAQIDGMEAQLSTQILGWTNSLNMTMLSPKDRVTNLTLPRRAEQILSYDLSRSVDAWDLGAHIMAQGSRFDDRANRTEVDGFVTVDLRTAYHLNKHFTLSAKLNNLLDKQYQTVDTYNNFGRNFFFTIHYNN